MEVLATALDPIYRSRTPSPKNTIGNAPSLPLIDCCGYASRSFFLRRATFSNDLCIH